MLSDQFTALFRREHRQVRDLLLQLVDAFQQRELPRVRGLLHTVAACTGPHFRYEEEALYPGLVEIFGARYVEKLFGDHDRAIINARRLVEIAQSDTLTDATATEAVGLVREILPHVSDCDGLSIMVEVLPEEATLEILRARDRCLDEGRDLLDWSSTLRERPLPAGAAKVEA